MKRIDETLEIAEELYEYSIVNKNIFVKEKAKLLIRNLAVIADKNNISNDDKYIDEIAKVKRKIPKWMKNTHQYNYRILKVFMDISNQNEYSVSVDELEKYSEIDSKIFLGHYNGMKTISVKNHGKVFDEVDKKVKLWEPVSEFIIGTFTEKGFIDKNTKEEKFREYIQQTVKNESTIRGYIKSLTEDFPSKLNIDNIFNIVDIDFLRMVICMNEAMALEMEDPCPLLRNI